MSYSAVISLAILKVNWENRNDYLDIFVPLVAETLRTMPCQNNIVVLAEVQQALMMKFGLNIPQNTLKFILRRAKKHEYLYQKNRIYYRNPKKLADLEHEFYVVQQKVLKEYEDLTSKFISYCQSEFNIPLTDKEADEIFQNYLRENELAIAGRHSHLSIISEASVSSEKRSNKFYLAAFIQLLETTHSPYFKAWETIVIGNMLANAVFLSDPTQLNRRFKKTKMYLDTSFLIYALGYAGEARKAPCDELLELLYETGVELRCFKHTFDEIKGILSACAYRIRSGKLRSAYGPSIEYFIEKGYSASDIELFIVQLERNLNTLRIQVVEKPTYEEYAYVIDEEELRKQLSTAINYRDPEGIAIYRDIDSISAIMRLRRGRKIDIVEEVTDIFVTNNEGLANVARLFFFDEKYPTSISPCITDYALTNILWLKRPHDLPDLPRKRIIADYYAAMQPDEDLLHQYYTEAEKLMNSSRITFDDYFLLRYCLDSKYTLMEVTHGGEDAVTELTVIEALELIQRSIKEEERKQLEEERLRREKLDQDIGSLIAKEEERKRRIKGRAYKTAKFLSRFIQCAAFILLVITTYSTFPFGFPKFDEEIWRYVFTGLQIGLLLLTITNAMFGTTIENLIRKLEIYLENKVHIILYNITS